MCVGDEKIVEKVQDRTKQSLYPHHGFSLLYFCVLMCVLYFVCDLFNFSFISINIFYSSKAEIDWAQVFYCRRRGFEIQLIFTELDPTLNSHFTHHRMEEI
jgi:hypothetical protein